MTDNNLFKLNLYELLYTKPMCDFINIEEDKKELNLLFIGSAAKAIETLKTVFWCAQYPKCDINIKIASKKEDMSVIQDEFCDAKKYPALSEYIKKGYVQTLKFTTLNYEDGRQDFKEIVKNDVKELDVINKRYTYIVIATENAFLDWRFMEILETEYDNCQNAVEQVLFAVYNKGITQNIEKIDKSKLAPNVQIVQFEKNEEILQQSDLYRVARNVNLAYCLKGDQRLSIAETNKQFEATCREEFEDKSNRYDADSSYASAVHIPYKLHLCKNSLSKNESSKEGLDILAEAIKQRNELYNQLIALEHRRWNAYMIMKGYRYPNEKEQKEMLFTDTKHPHIDKEKKLHMCLCDCQDIGLNPKMSEPKFWREENVKKLGNISELDYVSWFMHREADKRVRDIEKTFWIDYGFLSEIEYASLKNAIKRVFMDKPNSVNVYQKEYKKFYDRYSNDNNAEMQDKLKKINGILRTVIFRNKKVDYFENDAQLLDLLPLCTWFGKDYETVFIFSEGKAAEDIVIPTLLLAKYAVCIGGQDTMTEKYQRVMKEYFANRGNNTTVLFEIWNEEKSITELYQRCCEKYKNIFKGHQILTGNRACVAEIKESAKNVYELDYDAFGQEVVGKGYLFCGLEKQGLSVREFMRLNGGDVVSVSESPFWTQKFEEVRKLFWDNSEMWTQYVKLIESAIKNVELKAVTISVPNKNQIFMFGNSFQKEVYEESGIDEFLLRLKEFHLIANLVIERAVKKISVKFLTYQKEICELLKIYAEHDLKAITTKPEFSICGETILNNTSVYFTIDNIQADLAYVEKISQFYRKLDKMGLCSDFKLEKSRTEVKGTLVIRNNKMLQLFSKQGNMFEEVVYKVVQDTGLFEDVQLGVELLWDKLSGYTDVEYEIKAELDRICENNYLGLCNIELFKKIRDDIKKKKSNYNVTNTAHISLKNDNELDVIAMRGMKAYFISCKHIKPQYLKLEMVKQIAGEAELVSGKSLMAFGSELEKYAIKNIIIKDEEDSGKKISAWEKAFLKKQFSQMAFLGKNELSDTKVLRGILEKFISGQYKNRYF